MVHILGINLPNGALVKRALTSIYGVGPHTARRLCARLQVHDQCKVSDLSPFQVTSLASFLSSPATAPPLPRFPLARLDYVPPPPSVSSKELMETFMENFKKKAVKNADPLKNLKIESELRREVRENIAHQRMIGSYVGRRHAMHLPVRGQNTQNNAKTAKKLNRLDRY
ncbi:S13-like H2TH domain-containing protein [Pholiota conissans]|uniref:Small ribosomal subunit protein uS13m n=1 Tax=Pholiota conissans TaxID=109636 RepID=A0A9P6CR70_9AGAR|nr:S13-like H2TH domain-containing protein [Pholiota conissans]